MSFCKFYVFLNPKYQYNKFEVQISLAVLLDIEFFQNLKKKHGIDEIV